MPEKRTLERARRDKREGKAASTQAGEFVREEMDHVREGKHGARSSKQAIAIGLSKARRSGVDLPPPKKGATSEKTRKSAARAYARGHGALARSKASAKRSRANASAGLRPRGVGPGRPLAGTPVRGMLAPTRALQREGRSAASPASLARQTRSAASKRTKAGRSAAAKRAVRTKGPSERSAAARRAARSREERAGAHA